MAFVKQFLTKTQESENTSMFKYTPVLPSGEVEIYALISISNEVKAETSRFNKFVWDGFLDGFLSKEEDIISRLKNALVGGEFKLKELIKNDKALQEKGVDLNLSVLIFKGNKVFVGISGDHKVFLFQKKMVDLSELLEKNKANVGSTLVTPKDVLVVSFSEKSLKKDLENMKEVFEFEDFLQETFDKEGTKGGAFLATLEEEKEGPKFDPVPLPEEKEEVLEEKQPEEKKEEKDDFKKKAKGVLANVWQKLKLGLNSLVTFLSEKLSILFGKIKGILENKYGRKRWFKKLESVLSKKRFSKGVRPFKVDAYKEKDLRTRRFVTFFIVLVLLASVFFGVRAAYESRQGAALRDEVGALMEDWEDGMQKAERKASDDGDESLEIVSEISDELDSYVEELKEEGKYGRLREEEIARIDGLREQLFEIKDEIHKIIPVSGSRENFELFMDTKIDFGDKSDPVDFVISRDSKIAMGEVLYVVDAGEKKVYEVFLRDGNVRKVSDPNGLLKKPMYIDYGNNKDDEALYVYDAESGVLRAGLDEEGKINEFKAISGLTPRALGGEGVSAFAVFGPSDSLNFLVPEDSRIIKADGFGGTIYNLPSEYISHPSFEEGTDLFGDQYIYVLSTITNGIRRFVPITGLNSQLSVTGLQENVQSLVAGYTGTTMNRALILFDSESERFVQFTKPIEMGENLVHPGEIVLKAQYEYRGSRDDVFKDVKSLVLTHDDKFMYVLDGKKIWRINID